MDELGHARDSNERGGSRSMGLTIAGVIVAFLVALPFVFVVVLYAFITIYAIVRAIGPGAGENPFAIIIGFTLITSALTILLGMTIHLVGRSLTPKRRRRIS